MSQKGRIFRVTEAGRHAWQSQDPAVPSPYRRILGVVDPEAHYDVIRGFLRRYPDHLIQAWVGELQELRLLEPAPSSVQPELDFTAGLRLPALLAEDEQRLAVDEKDALAALAGSPNPVAQVVAIHQARVYRHMYHELFKWSLLPYPDAAEQRSQAEREDLGTEMDPREQTAHEGRAAWLGLAPRTRFGALRRTCRAPGCHDQVPPSSRNRFAAARCITVSPPHAHTTCFGFL